MEIHIWKELLDPYEQAVSELLVKFENLKQEFRKKNLYSPIESVCGRVKSVSSILDKMQTKGIPFEMLEDEVEDIAGIRIICQFVEDISKIADLIRKRTDMEVISLKNSLENQKKSGYRSFHMIVRYTVQTVNGPKSVQVEIQIRTMAMNFWATTEHSLQYKYKGDIPEHLTNALTKVARSNNSSDGATLYVTASPCLECSKLIIQSGIKRVVYGEEYRIMDGVELLKRAGIEVQFLNDKNE